MKEAPTAAGAGGGSSRGGGGPSASSSVAGVGKEGEEGSVGGENKKNISPISSYPGAALLSEKVSKEGREEEDVGESDSEHSPQQNGRKKALRKSSGGVCWCFFQSHTGRCWSLSCCIRVRKTSIHGTFLWVADSGEDRCVRGS